MDGVLTVGRGYATFPRRLLGLVVDSFILFVVLMAGVMGIAAAEPDPAWLGLVALVTALILYEPILVSTTGGTIGHHALNLRVVNEDQDVCIGFFQALLRAWLKGVLGLLFFLCCSRAATNLCTTR